MCIWGICPNSFENDCTIEVVQVLSKTRAAVLYQHIKLQGQVVQKPVSLTLG